jgi:hypothetical protein
MSISSYQLRYRKEEIMVEELEVKGGISSKVERVESQGIWGENPSLVMHRIRN